MAVLTRAAAGRRNWLVYFQALGAIPLACALGIPLGAEAGDDRTEYQVKAAFLYNFAKFVEWPPGAFKNASHPINICVLGASPVGPLLEDTVRNKLVDGRAFTIRDVTNAALAGDCQILFVSASEQKRLRNILETVKSSDVLTVGETEDFVSEGGVVGFNLDHGRIHFDINQRAAQLHRLRISSKLLSLATSVTKAEK